jgi:hypothetical protein
MIAADLCARAPHDGDGGGSEGGGTQTMVDDFFAVPCGRR